MKRLLCFVALMLCMTACVQATDVTLQWDASVTPTVTGYKVYYGLESRLYGTPITIGNITTYTVTALGAGTFFFAVTAIDAQGNESDFSNEVSQVILGKPGAPTNLKAKIIPK
jgi:fibronectin type 3 domain-containing protein